MMNEIVETQRQFREYTAETVITDLTARLPFLQCVVATVGDAPPAGATTSTLFPLVVVRATTDSDTYEDLVGMPPTSEGGTNVFVPLLFDGGITKLPVEFFEALKDIEAHTVHIAFVGLGGGVEYAEVCR